ncbi:hypothetical protein [Polynucleobacter sinensis]|uniref:hypothetical protein n=1 Tax=Polynucleobacter sinensis TaxID=1743157 RepID=UPI000ACA4D20|nr:hypothetical protein [Polynucleobacter sinensis]
MRMIKGALLSLCFFVSIASAATIPSQASGNYSAYCREEWTKRGVLDQNMFNYCMKIETEGYQNLTFLVQKYGNLPWIQKAIDSSVKNWTKKGSRQDNMVYFNLNQMIDGWEELKYQSSQPNFNKSKYQRCQQKWDFDYNMILYCYKND